MRRRAAGYTLVELALTLGLLALLAALALPGFRAARAAAERGGCTGNLKQLGSAWRMYLADYDDRFPATWRGEAPAAGQGYTWRIMWWPYVRNLDAYFCPADRLERRWDPSGGQRSVEEWLGESSYGANAVHLDEGGPTPPFDGRTNSPRGFVGSETIVFGEIQGRWPCLEAGGNRHVVDFTDNPALHRHRFGHYMMADGHFEDDPAEVRPACGSRGGADACPWSIE